MYYSSLFIRKMHFKTTRRCHLTPVRTAIIRRQEISVGDDGNKRESSALLVKMCTGAAVMENSVKIPHKL